MKFELGQVVYVQYTDRRPTQLTKALVSRVVTKIGRKWVTIAVDSRPNSYSERFDTETLQIDGEGYNSPGLIWPSEVLYEAHTRQERLWKALRTWFDRNHTKPDGLTSGDLLEAARVLGIEIDK